MYTYSWTGLSRGTRVTRESDWSLKINTQWRKTNQSYVKSESIFLYILIWKNVIFVLFRVENLQGFLWGHHLQLGL